MRGINTKAFQNSIEEAKKRGEFGPKAIASTIVMMIMFVGYALTFLFPKFYGMTEKYVGVFVFVMLVLLLLINVNPIKWMLSKDVEFYVLALLCIITFVNLVIVDSGFGCFCVVINFVMVFILCDKVQFYKWQVGLFAGVYVLFLFIWYFWAYPWMFADYTAYAYNTNTAATFAIYTSLCALIFFEILLEKYPIAGLFITVALIKAFQIGLYHRARGAFIMLMAYLLFRYVIPKKWWKNSKFYKGMCIFLTLGSLAFVAVYVVVGMSGSNFYVPFFYKNVFSGREAIWLEFFNLFKAKPLTGIGTNLTIESFFEFNVHNAMYNILVVHGVIVFAGVLFVMYRRLFKIQKIATKKPWAFAAMVAILAVCLESFFDVDLIWTDYSLNLLVLLLTANCAEIKN